MVSQLLDDSGEAVHSVCSAIDDCVAADPDRRASCPRQLQPTAHPQGMSEYKNFCMLSVDLALQYRSRTAR